MKVKNILPHFILILFLFQIVANTLATPSDSSSQKEVIKFADLQWQTLRINNAIARFIIEQGYGYPVETVMMSTPIMQLSLPKGDIDVDLELWRYNSFDWYNEVTSSGKVLDLGPIFEKATQGWYVPRYVVEGDVERGISALAPDLVSVFDLPKYKHLFKDPEKPDKGLFLSSVFGWKTAKINPIKFKAYGLTSDFNLMAVGATAAIDSAIVNAYEKGKPIFAFYWEPTWLMGAYDLIKIKEPEYTDACWIEIERILKNNIPLSQVTEKAGCAYRDFAVHKGIYAGLKERAPEIVDFLQKMNVGTVPLNQTALAMEKGKQEPEDAARWFLEHYPERWQSWIPEEVAKRVKKAMTHTEEIDLLSQLTHFPQVLKIPLDQWTDELVKWIVEEGNELFDFIGSVFLVPLLHLERILLKIPWFLIILAIATIAWRWSGWRLSLGTSLGMLFIGMLGLWTAAMSTLAIIIVATLLAVLIGIPVGILMSRSERFEDIMRPVLDIMQTMPSFVYLIPTLMLFGLGKVPALISTVVYSIPPVTRLTNLGIQQVPREMLEAGRAFGSTKSQLLFKVQLPLALPTIMAGINQTVMMALSMVVICSMIGAGGLGDEVLIGINQLQVGRGFTGGIGIVILAIIIDRLTQSRVAKHQQTIK